MAYIYNTELYHHGILGQRWGIRRYQNPDGTLTPAGKKRYYNSDGSLTRHGKKRLKQIQREQARAAETEARKQKAIEKGDVDYANEHIDDFSNEDINKLLYRYDTISKVSKAYDSKHPKKEKSKNKDDKNKNNQNHNLSQDISKVVKVAQAGSSLYNEAARVANAFGITKDAPYILPVGKKQEDKKDTQSTNKVANILDNASKVVSSYNNLKDTVNNNSNSNNSSSSDSNLFSNLSKPIVNNNPKQVKIIPHNQSFTNVNWTKPKANDIKNLLNNDWNDYWEEWGYDLD